MNTRNVLAVLLCASLMLSGAALAQSFPSKRVTILVGFPAGAVTDGEARILARHLEQAWQQPVIVENRPGAGALIAAQALVKAEPDGHTLFFTAASYTTLKVF